MWVMRVVSKFIVTKGKPVCCSGIACWGGIDMRVRGGGFSIWEKDLVTSSGLFALLDWFRANFRWIINWSEAWSNGCGWVVGMGVFDGKWPLLWFLGNKTEHLSGLLFWWFILHHCYLKEKTSTVKLRWCHNPTEHSQWRLKSQVLLLFFFDWLINVIVFHLYER